MESARPKFAHPDLDIAVPTAIDRNLIARSAEPWKVAPVAVAFQRIEPLIRYGGPILCIRSVAMPKRPRRVLAEHSLTSWSCHSGGAMGGAGHRLEWGGMADLDVDVAYVLGHVWLLRVGLSKTQNKESSALISTLGLFVRVRFSRPNSCFGGLSKGGLMLSTAQACPSIRGRFSAYGSQLQREIGGRPQLRSGRRRHIG